jgi:Zn-dependent protease with chaperone function
MSRKQEREADAFAARLVGDGVYRESLRTLWAHLDTGDAMLSRYVASHPSIRERAF